MTISLVSSSPAQQAQSGNLIQSQVKLKRTWTFGFEKEMIDFGIDKLIRPRIDPTKILPVENLRLPTDADRYVGWSATKIVKAPNLELLYSSEFSVCIAVLVRGFKKSDLSTPSHLGLGHIMGHPEIIDPMLLEIDQETDHGLVEIFICGGYKKDALSHPNYINLVERIKMFSQNRPNIQILDDHFSVMDLPGIRLIDKKQMAYRGTPGLRFAGFDANHNPYAVLGVTFMGFNGSRQDLVKFVGENENSEIVDCLQLPIRPSVSNNLLRMCAVLPLIGITLFALAKIYRKNPATC